MERSDRREKLTSWVDFLFADRRVTGFLEVFAFKMSNRPPEVLRSLQFRI